MNYYTRIPNYDTIKTLPEENAEYIKEALPNVSSCYCMMGSVFIGCNALTSIDTTGWDTSNVTDMVCMFGSCSSLTTLDVSKFNTSKVIDMGHVFDCCYSLTTLDLSNWDISKVSSVYGMFSNCRSLTTLDVSNWDTSKVTDMYAMFRYCYALTTIKGAINMKSCTSYDNMFIGCTKLSGVKIKNPPSGFTDKYASEISSGKIVIVQ